MYVKHKELSIKDVRSQGGSLASADILRSRGGGQFLPILYGPLLWTAPNDELCHGFVIQDRTNKFRTNRKGHADPMK